MNKASCLKYKNQFRSNLKYIYSNAKYINFN